MKQIYITLILLAWSLPGMAQQAPSRAMPMSVKATEAFQIKAVDKIEEFYNYIELITDPALSDEMKEHTATEALKLFSNPDTNVYNVFIDSKKGKYTKRSKYITAKELITKSIAQKQKHVLNVDKNYVEVREANSGAINKWLILYNLSINNNKAIRLKQTFIFTTEKKKFGSTVKEVINSYLGEVTMQ